MSNQENENDTQEKLHMVQHYSLGFDLSESKTFETHIRIDTEFKARNRKLTACEYEKLEASIIEEGVRDPLVLWNGILIDGHNRFEIAQRHGLEYKTVENTTLASREEVRTWIIRNQLGRRNNTPNETSYLIGKLYESMKKSHGGDRGNQYTEPSTQDGNLAKTAEKVGKEHGVSKNTVIRDAEFSEAIDRVGEKIGQEAKVAILSGEAKVAKKDIETLLEIAEESPESIDPIIKGEKTVAQVTKEIKQDKLKEKKREYVTSLNVYQPVIEQCDVIEWLVKQEKCDLLITDPPYMTDVENIEEFALNWLPVALEKVKDTGRAYICIGSYPRELEAYLSTTPPDHLVRANILVWTYRNTLGPSPKFDYKNNWQAVLYYRGVSAPALNCPEMVEQFTVQDISAPDGRHGTRFHAWQKPDELGRRFVCHGSKEGDIVFDPFAGTGTFLMEAGKLGRVARGCELADEMLKISEDRGCKVVRK